MRFDRLDARRHLLADDIDISSHGERAFRRLGHSSQDRCRSNDEHFLQIESAPDLENDVLQLTAAHDDALGGARRFEDTFALTRCN